MDFKKKEKKLEKGVGEEMEMGVFQFYNALWGITLL